MGCCHQGETYICIAVDVPQCAPLIQLAGQARHFGSIIPPSNVYYLRFSASFGATSAITLKMKEQR
jgi:hypothetical protein